MATKTTKKKQAVSRSKAAAAFPLFDDVAIATHTPCTITQLPRVATGQKRCVARKALDLSGRVETRVDGQIEFMVKNFICPVDGRFTFPLNFVATAISPKPIVVTVTYSIVNNGANIKVVIFSWDVTGVPAPGVPVDWRCRVQLP